MTIGLGPPLVTTDGKRARAPTEAAEELQRALNLVETWAAKPGPRRGRCSAEHSKETTEDLQLTFGYAASLDKCPAFAKYDIRDQVCFDVGGFRHGQVVRDDDGNELVAIGVKRWEGKRRLWFQPRDMSRRAAGTFGGTRLRERLTPVGELFQQLHEAALEDFEAAEDSDGEEMQLCKQCHLPIGDFAYTGDDAGAQELTHGECMARLMLHEAKSKEEAFRRKEAAYKKKSREEYDIGWTAARIPLNSHLATKFQQPAAGMYCLVLPEDSERVQVVPTSDPAASVNLEYLSVALQVRMNEGREAFFSLDPRDTDGAEPMQVKRFEPEWLADTSVGELLFQADYHLKELSMGEYEQPVVGMRSGFEWSEVDGSSSNDWSAREWFVVRRAEVLMSEDDALIASLSMGVEARSQVENICGVVVDAPITRPDHPLVQYAESFTHRFDLIAERKSVIFQLRELAKASVLAKFLVDGGVQLEPTFFSISGKLSASACTEVPQLWNERTRFHLKLQGREIARRDRKANAPGVRQCTRSVYGGVDMGLARFPLTRPNTQAVTVVNRNGYNFVRSVVPEQTGNYPITSHTGHSQQFERDQQQKQYEKYLEDQKAQQAAEAAAAAPAPKAKAAVAGAPSAVAVPRGPPRAGVPRRAAGRRPRAPAYTGGLAVRGVGTKPGQIAPIYSDEPAGVDLNLDSFDLTARPQHQVAPKTTGACASWCKLLREGSCYRPGESTAAAGLEESDAQLLQAIFNPNLCDRRDEGDAFVLPDPEAGYVEKLRQLVNMEEAAKRERRECFLGPGFNQGNPGPLFPIAWARIFELEDVDLANAEGAVGKARSDLMEGNGAVALRKLIHSSAAIFDKITEDGLRFRIYHVDGLELRTIQGTSAAGEEPELVGAAYQLADAGCASFSEGAPPKSPRSQERIVKVTERVESEAAKGGSAFWTLYLVFETEAGSSLLLEKRIDGTGVVYEENPLGLARRNSLARVVRSVERRAGLTVCDVRAFAQAQMQTKGREPSSVSGHGSWSHRKHFAQAAYAWACGQIQCPSGFWRLDSSQGNAKTAEKSAPTGKSCRRRQLEKYLKFRADNRLAVA